MSAHSRQDSLLLQTLHDNGNYEAGLYASAFRLLDVCNIAGYLMASFLFPFIARNRTDKKLTANVLKNCRNMLMIASIILIVLFAFFSSRIYQLLYTHDNFNGSIVLALTMMALPGYYLVHVYGTYLSATGHINRFLQITIFFMIVNLVANVLFIPAYGARACAIIAVISQSCYGLVLWLVVKRVFQTRAISIGNH
jgi:O-antigen/teichoic acid export membrane protein